MIKQRLRSLAILLVVALGAAGLVIWQRQRAEAEQASKDKESKVLALTSLDDVRSVRLEGNPQSFLVERVEAMPTRWQVKEPIVTAADDSTLDSLGRALVDLKYKSKVSHPGDTAQDLGLYGLAPARFTVTLVRKDGGEETLLVGKKNSFDGSLYVQRQGGTDVLLVHGTITYQLETDLFRLRDKTIAHFDTTQVARLAVEKNGRPLYAIEKQGEGYRIAAPVDLPADNDKVRGMLSTLSSLRASEFIAEKASAADLSRTHLAQPALRISLGFTDAAQAPLTVLYGKAGSGDDTQTYAMLEGQHPIVEITGDSLTAQLDVTVDALRDKTIAHFDREAVRGVTIEDGAGVTLEFAKARDDAKERDGWKMLRPKAVDAHDSTLEGLLYAMSSLKAQEIVQEKASTDALVQHGLGPTAKRITLLGKDKEQLAQVLLGKIEGDKQFVTAAGSGRLDAVESSRLSTVSFVESGYVDAPKTEADNAAGDDGHAVDGLSNADN